jgi:hypothetical protein
MSLYRNIHAKRKRIKAGSGEKMRKPGQKGRPTAKNFQQAKRKVPKTKKGVPKKYVSGAKNPTAREKEILRTRKLYRQGKLTKAMMDAISKRRSKG